MPLDLDQLVAPTRTALLIMECQQGVIGAGAGMNALADAVERNGIVHRIAALAAAARAAAVPVFYLNASRRADQRGTSANCLLLALGRKSEPLVVGSPRQAVVAELAPQPQDFVINRLHGITPFHGTELDSLLRNQSIATVIATGVSVNVGITGLTMEAVSSGYQVVIPRDAVAGTPESYVDSVFEHTLRLLATVCDSSAVIASWSSSSAGNSQ